MGRGSMLRTFVKRGSSARPSPAKSAIIITAAAPTTTRSGGVMRLLSFVWQASREFHGQNRAVHVLYPAIPTIFNERVVNRRDGPDAPAHPHTQNRFLLDWAI